MSLCLLSLPWQLQPVSLDCPVALPALVFLSAGYLLHWRKCSRENVSKSGRCHISNMY